MNWNGKESDGMILEPFASRMDRFRTLIRDESLDAFLVAVPENRYYLSGYYAEDLQLTESSGYLLITDARQYVLTDPRYEQDALRDAPEFEVVIYKQGIGQVLPDLFSSLLVTRVGFESHHLTYGKFLEIEGILRKTNPDGMLVGMPGLVERLRVVKEPAEIAKIRASLALTESVVRSVWESLRQGRTEKSVAWEIERGIREGGGEAVSFPPIVAGGLNAALPHAVPTGRVISSGEPVILDLGSKLDHYCSDMTRTWVSGALTGKLNEIYRVVREAQMAAQDAVRAGIDSTVVDGIARGIIAAAGYGDFFGHGLGHGVGLAVHELPGLRRQGGTILEENMVITIEPGIYLPGNGGVRLENMVLVTSGGCEVLNQEDLFYD